MMFDKVCGQRLKLWNRQLARLDCSRDGDGLSSPKNLHLEYFYIVPVHLALVALYVVRNNHLKRHILDCSCNIHEKTGKVNASCM